MTQRALASGVVLSQRDAALIKGMLKRGDRQHDIAAFFGVNGGRIAEIATRTRFHAVEPASEAELPPSGPYPAGRVAVAALAALSDARAAIAAAEAMVRRTL